jgi:hypothetical protein
MQTRSAVVVRGTVDVPDAGVLGQRSPNLLNSAHAARTGAHIRRYWPGDTITTDDGISVAELKRLVLLGVCKWV